jgi:hypothetical protein
MISVPHKPGGLDSWDQSRSRQIVEKWQIYWSQRTSGSWSKLFGLDIAVKTKSRSLNLNRDFSTVKTHFLKMLRFFWLSRQTFWQCWDRDFCSRPNWDKLRPLGLVPQHIFVCASGFRKKLFSPKGLHIEKKCVVELSLGVSIGLDRVLIKSLDLDIVKKCVLTVEKSRSRSRLLNFVFTAMSRPKSLDRDREIHWGHSSFLKYSWRSLVHLNKLKPVLGTSCCAQHCTGFLDFQTSPNLA